MAGRTQRYIDLYINNVQVENNIKSINNAINDNDAIDSLLNRVDDDTKTMSALKTVGKVANNRAMTKNVTNIYHEIAKLEESILPKRLYDKLIRCRLELEQYGYTNMNIGKL